METSIATVSTLLGMVMVMTVVEVFAAMRYEKWQHCDSWCLSQHSAPMRLWKDAGRKALADFPEDVFPSRLVLQGVEDALRVAVRDNHVVVLHDGQPGTKSILQGVLESLGVPLILLDIGNPGVIEASWLGAFNSASYVHLLLFGDSVTVMDFLEWLPEHTWVPQHLLLLNTNWSVDAASILSHTNLRHSSFLTLLQPHLKAGGTPTHRILTYETFKPNNKIVQRGSLNSSLSFSSLFPDRFSSFHGHHFHLSSWTDDFPYMIPGETLEDVYGIGINMLNNIGSIYNFTYEIYEKPKDGLWGDLTNGTWRGMIGEVKREERDFCINVMGFTEDQFRAVDFSVPYIEDGFSFMLTNPLPPPRWWSIAFPLSWDTWIALLMFVLLLPIPLFLVIKVHRAAKASLSKTYLEVVRTLLHQDITHLSNVHSARIFLGVWLLAAMVVSISYTGNLVAYITVPAKPQILTTVEQLAEADIIPTMLDYGTLIPAFLNESEDPTLRKLGEKLLLIPPEPYQYGFDLIKTGRHAFLEGTEYFRYTAIRHRVTNAYFLQEMLYSVNIGWIFPKHTAWKHKFDLYLQRFVESGLITFWKKRLAVDMRKKVNITENNVEVKQSLRPLNLDDLKGIFFLYLVGLFVVVVTGVWELIQHSVDFSTDTKTKA